MSDRDALLAAITADPDDDTPRLVYADWLDEHGDGDRAEFVRAQCRLEHVSRRSAEDKRLAARAKELQARLFGPLAEIGFADLTFRRGFVDTVRAGVQQFRDLAAALTPDLAPAFGLRLEEDARDTKLSDDAPDSYAEAVGQLARWLEVRRCVALDLPCLGMNPAAALLESDHWVNLRRINFPGNEAGPTVELVAAPTFANLRWANFRNSDSAADCPSITPLAECPHLANLEHLDFGECEQGGDDARAVAASPHWTRLRFLSLAVSSFDLDDVAALFHTDHLPALAELDLSYTFNSFGDTSNPDEYAGAIAGSPLFARLARLRLVGNNLTDDEAKALAGSPRELRLELLDLGDNPIGPAGRRALRKRFGPGVCRFGEGDR